MNFVNTASLISALSPWFVGGALAFLSFPRFLGDGHWAVALRIISIPIGGFLGYLILGVCLWIMHVVGLRFLATQYVTPMFISIVACIFLAFSSVFYNLIRELRRHDVIFNTFVFAPILFLGVIAVIFVFIQETLPVQGWDVLDFWADTSARIITHQNESPELEFKYWRHHPYILPLISAWSAWLPTTLGGVSYGMAPWGIMFIGCGVVVYGFAADGCNAGSLWPLMLGVLTLSVPLLENHAFVAGYSEIFVSFSTLSSTVLVALGLRHRAVRLVIGGLAIGCTAFMLRNTGLFYAGTVFLSLLLSKARGPQVPAICAAGLVAACAVLVYLWWLSGVSFSVAGNQIGFSDSGEIIFGGKRMALSGASFSDIVLNQIIALSRNASFSLLFIAYFILIAGAARRCFSDATLFLVVYVAVSLMILTCSQIFDYGFAHAGDGYDTGNSRFTLPVILCTIPAVAAALADLQKPKKTLPLN